MRSTNGFRHWTMKILPLDADFATSQDIYKTRAHLQKGFLKRNRGRRQRGKHGRQIMLPLLMRIRRVRKVNQKYKKKRRTMRK